MLFKITMWMSTGFPRNTQKWKSYAMNALHWIQDRPVFQFIGVRIFLQMYNAIRLVSTNLLIDGNAWQSLFIQLQELQTYFNYTTQ
jgi:hypothetical protein